uniref:Uncharacterized protein n=1 Tax=Anguilla anguilla TaxID=7936 RepID=A0A0E9RTV7_ANGAN
MTLICALLPQLWASLPVWRRQSVARLGQLASLPAGTHGPWRAPPSPVIVLVSTRWRNVLI